jgi:photosystem II stability/assembly factor-like uncharacterized protein
MKCAVNTLVLALGLFSPAAGQSDWQWRNPLPQGNSFFAIKTIPPNVIIAAGNAATIQSSTDEGGSWSVQFLVSGQNTALRAFAAPTRATWIAVGGGGTILRTTDAGESWTSGASGTTASLYGISFPDSADGTIVGGGGCILHTSDGGLSWTPQTSGTTNNLYGVAFVNTDSGIAVGAGGSTLHTTDGGTTWTSPSSGTTLPLYGISYAGKHVAVAAGASAIIVRTTDGGSTWLSQGEYPPGTELFAVSFSDSATGIAVGALEIFGTAPYIFRTTDGGISWTTDVLGSLNGALRGISFNDSTAYSTGSYGLILRSTNRGESWASLASGSHFDLQSVALHTEAGFAVGRSGTVLHTANGGNAWTQQSSPMMNTLFGVATADSMNATAVGEFGAIIRTVNGGTTWTSQTSGTTDALHGVSFVDSSTGTAVGTGGRILRTTNAGTSWVSQFSGGTTDLNAVWATDVITATAAGGAGRIIGTTDGGSSWHSLPSGTTAALNCIQFNSHTKGTIVGNGGVILQSTNGGMNWISQSSGTSNNLNSVSFINDSVGVVVGESGTILFSLDGGATWTPVQPPTFNALKSIAISGGGSIVTTGEGGTILSSQLELKFLRPPPAAPTGLAAEAGDKRVTLTWTANTESDLLRYRIYRGATSPANTKIDSVGVGAAMYSDTNVVNQAAYFYRITAVDSALNESNFSNEVSGTPLPPALSPPVLLFPANRATGQFLSLGLNWSSVFGATGYRVEVSIDSLFVTRRLDDSTTRLSEDTGPLQHSTKYFWRVQAFNNEAVGPWSDVWQFTTIVPLSGFGTAAIDGAIASREWDNAGHVDFMLNLPEGGTTTARLYFMNDSHNIYLAIDYNRGSGDLGTSMEFDFDRDNNGIIREEGDDYVVLNSTLFGTPFEFFDGVWTSQPPCPPNSICGFTDTSVGGTSDGAGAFHNNGARSVHELSHPLMSGDVLHDFSLTDGDVISFRLFYRLFGPTNNFADTYLQNSILVIQHPPHIIKAAAGSDGSISPSGSVVVVHGSDTTFTMIPSTGHHIDSVFVDGGFVGPVAAYTFTNVTTDHTISVTFAVNTTSTVQTAVFEGWNLVSIPVTVADYAQTTLFPTATSGAFAYQGAYLKPNVLANGFGYWLKFAASETLQVQGFIRHVDSISVVHRWNLIGSITSRVSVSTIESEPPGLVVSEFYAYSSDEGRYLPSGIIEPGKGYWVRANQPGKLILSSLSTPLPANRIRIIPITEPPPSSPVQEANVGVKVPTQFKLEENYPNPFNPVTVIRYQLPVQSLVRLSIFNVLGQEISILVDGFQDAGYKSVQWDASGMPSGVYLYRLKTPNVVEVKKMVLTK